VDAKTPAGETLGEFFMVPAIQDFVLVYLQEPSHINQKVKSGKNLSLFRTAKPHHLRGDVHVSRGVFS
jgi:hypothetical protein